MKKMTRWEGEGIMLKEVILQRLGSCLTWMASVSSCLQIDIICPIDCEEVRLFFVLSVNLFFKKTNEKLLECPRSASVLASIMNKLYHGRLLFEHWMPKCNCQSLSAKCSK